MSISYTVFSSICEPLLVFLALLLQLIALCTSWWAHFTARTDLGKPIEKGHYGLWTLCTTKAPRWNEDCDPLDTFFELPSFFTVSGILCIVHILLLVIYIPLGSLKLLQVFKKNADLGINPKLLRILEVSTALILTLIASLVAVFASIGENNQKEYFVHKGWSFWIQVVVILLDIALFAFSFTELFRFLKLQWQQEIDPEGKRAETYGNPTFDADSPELPRSHPPPPPPNNGVISYTESSGYPYSQNPVTHENKKDLAPEKNPTKSKGKDSVKTLTYENECYLESSPRSRRRQ